MTTHDIVERTRLLSHQRYAELIDTDHSILDRVNDYLQNADDCLLTLGQRDWKVLLKKQWAEVKREMLRDDPRGRLLRSNSPFSSILGEGDPDRRRLLWRQATSELLPHRI